MSGEHILKKHTMNSVFVLRSWRHVSKNVSSNSSLSEGIDILSHYCIDILSHYYIKSIAIIPSLLAQWTSYEKDRHWHELLPVFILLENLHQLLGLRTTRMASNIWVRTHFSNSIYNISFWVLYKKENASLLAHSLKGDALKHYIIYNFRGSPWISKQCIHCKGWSENYKSTCPLQLWTMIRRAIAYSRMTRNESKHLCKFPSKLF